MPCYDKKKLIFFSVLAVSGMYKIFKIKKNMVISIKRSQISFSCYFLRTKTFLHKPYDVGLCIICKKMPLYKENFHSDIHSEVRHTYLHKNVNIMKV